MVAVERGGERVEALAGVGDEHRARVLGRVERRDVEVDEPHARVLERGARRRGEVGVPGADADHDVGLAGQRVGDRRAGGADAADGLRVVHSSAPLPAWVSATGMPVASANARSASVASE